LRSLTLYNIDVRFVMKIRNVRHKGLRRLVENDDSSGVPAAVATKLRKMVGFLQSMEQEVELHLVPS
jgi:toxin HigB-1